MKEIDFFEPEVPLERDSVFTLYTSLTSEVAEKKLLGFYIFSDTVNFGDITLIDKDGREKEFDPCCPGTIRQELVLELRQEIMKVNRELRVFRASNMEFFDNDSWLIILNRYGFFDPHSEPKSFLGIQKEFGLPWKRIKRVCNAVWPEIKKSENTRGYTEQWMTELADRYRCLYSIVADIQGRVHFRLRPSRREIGISL